MRFYYCLSILNFNEIYLKNKYQDILFIIIIIDINDFLFSFIYLISFSSIILMINYEYQE